MTIEIRLNGEPQALPADLTVIQLLLTVTAAIRRAVPHSAASGDVHVERVLDWSRGAAIGGTARTRARITAATSATGIRRRRRGSARQDESSREHEAWSAHGCPFKDAGPKLGTKG